MTVETRDDVLVGQLESFHPERGARLSGDSFVRLGADEVLEIRFVEHLTGPRRPAGWVGLRDGSLAPFDSYSIEGDRVKWTVTRGDGDPIHATSPVASIVSLSFRGDQRGVEAPEGVGVDVVLIKPRSGGAARRVEGTIVGLNGEFLRFSLDADAPDDAVDVPWNRLAGLRFFRGPVSQAGVPHCIVDFVGGGRVLADRYDVTPDQTLVWASKHSDGQAPFESLAAIDISAGRVSPVAAWELQSQTREAPLVSGLGLGPKPTYALGRAFERMPLRLNWPDPRAPTLWPNVAVTRSYQRGIAVRGGVALTFRLPVGATRLRGLVGLDPATALAGDAEVSIRADDSVIWSGRVDGTTPPVELNEPLLSPARLTVRVNQGHNLDTGDHLHFVDLRVIQ